MDKKISIYILLSICIFALTGCGKKNEVEPAPTPSEIMTTSIPEPTPEPLPEGVAYAEELIELGILDEVEEISNAESNVTVEMELPTEPEAENPAQTEKPEEEIPEENELGENDSCCEYGAYLDMTPEEQEAYMNSFETTMDFIVWSQAATAVHQEHVITADEAGAVLDISQFING